MGDLISDRGFCWRVDESKYEALTSDFAVLSYSFISSDAASNFRRYLLGFWSLLIYVLIRS